MHYVIMTTHYTGATQPYALYTRITAHYIATTQAYALCNHDYALYRRNTANRNSNIAPKNPKIRK